MKPQRLFPIFVLAAACMVLVVSCKPRHAEEDDFIKDFNVLTDKNKGGGDTNAGKSVQADKTVAATVWDTPTRSGTAYEALKVLWRGKPDEMRRYFDALNVDAGDADKGELCHLKGVANFLLAKKDRSLKSTAVECFEKAHESTAKQKFKALSMLWLGMTYYSYYSDAESLKKGLSWLDRVTEEYPRTRFANDAVLYKGLIKRQLGQTEEYKEMLLGLERGGYPDIYVYWIPTSSYVRAKDAVNYLLRGVPFYYGSGGGYVAVSGSISDAKGTFAVKANGANVKTNIGSRIAAGYEIITDADGEVTIDLKTIGVLKVMPGTSMNFAALSPSAGIAKVEVTKGKALFAVPKLGKKSSYSVVTDVATFKVTGTAFAVGTDGKAAQVSVLRGIVNVTNAAGGTNVTELQDASVVSTNSVANVVIMKKSSIDDIRSILDIKGVEKYESKEALTDKVDRVTMRVAKEDAEAARARAEAAKAQADSARQQAESAKAQADAKARAAEDAKAKAQSEASAANTAKSKAEKDAADAKAAKDKAEKDAAAANAAKAKAEKDAADAKAAASKTPATTTTTTTTTTSTNKTTTKKAADDW